LLKAGLIDEDAPAMLDSSWSPPVFSTTELSAGTVEAFRRQAIRRFYFRPSYLFSRLTHVGSWVELRNQIENGAVLAWQSIQSAGIRPASGATRHVSEGPTRESR